MALDIVPGLLEGNRIKSYEDTLFESSDSPRNLTVYLDMGRYPSDGYIVCDGDGNIILSISDNGINFGDSITMKKNEIINVAHLKIHTLRITHSGTDSSYRIALV